MAILEEIRKIANAKGVETTSQDITEIINAMATAKGGDGKGRNIREATAGFANAVALENVTVEAEAGTTKVFEHTVSDLQTDLAVANGKVTGTLRYVEEGALPEYWGAGHFMVLKFSLPETVTSCMVGLDPSVSSGLVELVGDPDMNCAAKVTDPAKQKFKMVVVNNGVTAVQELDLSELVLEPAPNEEENTQPK